MNKSITFVLTISLFFYGNIQTVNSQTVKSKSISSGSKEHQKLLLLVRNLYKWVETKDSMRIGFETLESENPKDSLYVGVDMNIHKKRMIQLRHTKLFSEEFIKNQDRIAVRIDKNLRNKVIEWHIGEMPPFGNDTNPWCGCQDNPDNYWETMIIKNVKINNNTANFVWTWVSKEITWKNDKHNYKVKAIKENGVWKILYLQGFDFEAFTKVWDD
jgi:hypothetical protein